MFRTMQPFDKNKMTSGKILRILMFVMIGVIVLTLLLAMIPQFFRYKDRMMEATFAMNMVLITLIILNFINYAVFKSKKGNFIGNLELKDNGIVLNGENFSLENIDKIRFIGNDIKGQFRGFNTKGTENTVTLTTNDQRTVTSVFEQTTENNLKNYADVLKIYFEQHKLSQSNYENILNNTNYY